MVLLSFGAPDSVTRKTAARVVCAASLALLVSCRQKPVGLAPSGPARTLGSSNGLEAFPALSPDGRLVAYGSDQTGHFEIYVRSLDTAEARALTSDGRENFEPAFSPDGKRLAYHSKGRGGIWLVDVEGGQPTPLTDFGSRPAFSPDGSLVAFQSEPLNDLGATSADAVPPSTIWTVSSRGGPPHAVTKEGDPPGGHGAPTFTRDGSRLLFVATDPKLAAAVLWSVTLDGSTRSRLLVRQRIYDPIVSPDGKLVLFGGIVAGFSFGVFAAPYSVSALGEPRLLTAAESAVTRSPSLSADGSHLVYASLVTAGNIWSLPVTPAGEVSGEPRELTTGKTRSGWPLFSPDGSLIAFGRYFAGKKSDIWVMDPDGRNARPVADDPSNEYVQDWFPDGKHLFALSDRTGRFACYKLDVETRAFEPLPIDPPDMGNPRLSPDGRSVVYNSKSGGVTLNVWRMEMRGGPPRQLTFDRELLGFPSWSPDGGTLAMQVKRGDDEHVVVMASDGGAPEQLTFDHGLSWPHTFSPDGDKIAFAGLRDNVWNLYWVSRKTRAVRKLTQLTRLTGYVRYPAWSPDGRQIAYERAEITGRILLLGR